MTPRAPENFNPSGLLYVPQRIVKIKDTSNMYVLQSLSSCLILKILYSSSLLSCL